MPVDLKPHKGSASDPKLQLQLLYNHAFPYKTQSSSTKLTLVEVFRCIPDELIIVIDLFY